MSESLTARSFEAGEMVCRSREMASSLYFVVSGRVQIFRTTRNDRRFVVATLGPGSMFGEESVLGGSQTFSSAVALEQCTLWVFPKNRAMEISSTNAMFGFGLMQAMGQRLEEAENRLELMAFGSVASRLAALLLELSGSDPEGAVRATHQQLADMLGTWRETISKTLRVFRQQGLVASGRRRLILLDIKGLKVEAGELS
ncbi:MAG: Crp/Fnr family transcriptional regulator [Anaerolineae bacterium]